MTRFDTFVRACVLYLALTFPAPPVISAQRPADEARALAAADRVVHAVPVRGTPPVIDGKLDEPVWSEASPASDFTQRWPEGGAPSTQRTEVRVAFDDDALYVAMRMFDDDPAGIVAHVGRRNQMLDSDWARVLIDSSNDRRTAFEFAVTPAGSRRDVFHFDDTRSTVDWNAVWEVATQIDSLGWTAEFRIPLSQLRYAGGRTGERVWGINFVRFITRTWEQAWWAPTPPDVDRTVSLFGELRGLEELPSPRRVEILPYLATDLTRSPHHSANPLRSPTELGGSVGLDVRYGLTPDLTLSGTINPDFGQVEADPAVVNLTALEVFFPEQRPFFLEGADIFDFRLMGADGPPERLFHSRRIGRAPQRSIDVPGGWVDSPSNVPILGATKLSGQFGGAWSAGVQSALTGGARARIIEPGGRVAREVVEPPAHYGVGRVARNVDGGRGNVGGILTGSHRRISDPAHGFVHDAAYAVGMDGSLRFADDRFRARGWVAGSRVEGTPEALERTQRSPVRYLHRPDADHLTFDPTRTSMEGLAGEGGLEKLTGTWTGRLLGGARGAGFEINDLGFQQFSDLRYGMAALAYNRYAPGDRFRDWSVTSGATEWQTFGGERLQRSAHVRMDGTLTSFWGGSLQVEHGAPRLGVRELRGGPAIRLPASTEARVNVRSDMRRPVVGRMGAAYRAEHGWEGRRITLQPGLDLRPTTRTRLLLSPRVEWNVNPAQYVATERSGPEPRYLHGRLRQTTVDLTTRLGHAFSPDLSLDVYLQPFVSAGSYDRFNRVVTPRASDPDDRFHPVPIERTGDGGLLLASDQAGAFAFRDPEFKVRRLNVNSVLRWEFLPGSTLYAVWAREDSIPGEDPSLRLRSDLSKLFGGRGTSVFMLKASYWLNP
jgi:hypothetical protein